MRVLVAGGDGFCGRSTSLHLSARGHEVFVADNFNRRRWDKKPVTEPLTRNSGLETRVARWEEPTARKIEIAAGDLADERFVHEIVDGFSTDVLVRFAEPR